MINKMSNARRMVLDMLIKMEKSKSYSNILLDENLTEANFDSQDKKFVAALFYGIVERQLTLDRIIKKYSSKKLSKLDIDIKQILRMGIYQLLYMDSVPESAAVNESVKLAKMNKNPALGGFVNAVLRSFIRDNKKLPQGRNEIEKLSIEYSCPEWLISMWIKDYGIDKAEIMLKSSLGRPPITIRVNSTKISAEKLIDELAAEGIAANIVDGIDNCLRISNSSSIEKSLAYNKGYFHVQDISSQLCCMALGATQGETVLDLCAAPGGKTFTLAEMMDNKGMVYAFDLHEKRVKLIAQGSERLGLDIIKAQANNAKVYNQNIPLADKILCDVPCSGLGVIRRKPEIKRKDPQEFNGLYEIQYEILETSAKYLKVGGEMIYSTCTLNKKENDDVIERFLDNHEEFEAVTVLKQFGETFEGYKATITPDFINSDGFFIAKVRKKR